MIEFNLTHLQQLEAESIHIFREVAAEFQRPVMLYSVGKDSSVLVRLARKAFHPGPIPFPLLHVDTGFKFREMLEFRDKLTRDLNVELLVHRNEEAIAAGTNPFRLGTPKCCGLLKTEALLQGLRAGNYDAAVGGARRDEDKSRAKERVYSFRDSIGQWDPNGPRTPMESPGLSLAMARVTVPTSRTVCISGPSVTGSPLIDTGISPTPKMYSMLNCPAENGSGAPPSEGFSSSVNVSWLFLRIRSTL